jgi:hypothetical protein
MGKSFAINISSSMRLLGPQFGVVDQGFRWFAFANTAIFSAPPQTEGYYPA